jgi:Fe2+ transport system protein FeoA
MPSHGSIRLSDVPVGVRVRIRHLKSHPDVSRRLRELGFCENAVIRCVTKGYGNIICEVFDTRVGLNRGLAGDIMVSTFE